MFKIFNSVYSPLTSRSESRGSDEEHRGFIDGKHYDHDGSSNPKPDRRGLIPHYSIIIFPWVLAILNFGLFLNQYLRHPSDLECARRLSPYSPAIDAGVIEYYDTNFQNAFGGRSEYMGPPTPELEERWDDLWSRGTIELPLDGPGKLNKSTEGLKHARGDPSRGYAAVLEVFHHLHCLNQIRQYTWREYYATHMADWVAADDHGRLDLDVTGAGEGRESVGDRMHVDHCIEALRLQLMCAADVTPLLVEVDRGSSLGQRADFDVHHRCRRWDRVAAWQDAHSVEREEARGEGRGERGRGGDVAR